MKPAGSRRREQKFLSGCAGATAKLCAPAASVPAPSIRGRPAALGRPAPGGRVAHSLALYRRLAGPLWARPFSPLRALWALGRAAPGARCFSFGTGPVKPAPPAAPGFGCVARCASPCLRPRVPLSGPALASLPPPVLWPCPSVGRARGSGLQGGRGCAPLWPSCALDGSLLPPVSSPALPVAWLRLRRLPPPLFLFQK